MKWKLNIIFLLHPIIIFVNCNKDDDGNIKTQTKGLKIEIAGVKNNDGQIILDLTYENENRIDSVFAEIAKKMYNNF